MGVRALPLAKALAQRGHELHMILPSWYHPEDAGREWVEEGVAICNIPLPSAAPGVQHLVAAGRMLRRVLDVRPDVVHCFKPKAHSGMVAMGLLCLRRLGIFQGRIVVDTDDWEGRGGWNEIEGYGAAQRALFAWQERWGLRHADALTVASRTLESLAWSLGVSPSATHYLPNGVSCAKMGCGNGSRVREMYGLGESLVILLYTRFFEYDLERVVTVLSRAVGQVPDARVLVVGRGLFGEEERFVALARECGLHDAMVYAGWVSAEELPDYFACADMAIYPFEDSLVNRAKCSVKLVDLLDAGLAVVADRVGQNREYIENGASGLLPGDNKDGLVSAVVSVLTDESLRLRLGAAAQERVRRAFGWPRLAEVAERAYGA